MAQKARTDHGFKVLCALWVYDGSMTKTYLQARAQIEVHFRGRASLVALKGNTVSTLMHLMIVGACLDQMPSRYLVKQTFEMFVVLEGFLPE